MRYWVANPTPIAARSGAAIWRGIVRWIIAIPSNNRTIVHTAHRGLIGCADIELDDMLDMYRVSYNIAILFSSDIVIMGRKKYNPAATVATGTDLILIFGCVAFKQTSFGDDMFHRIYDPGILVITG
jgi:hypothetical protein